MQNNKNNEVFISIDISVVKHTIVDIGTMINAVCVSLLYIVFLFVKFFKKRIPIKYIAFPIKDITILWNRVNSLHIELYLILNIYKITYSPMQDNVSNIRLKNIAFLNFML